MRAARRARGRSDRVNLRIALRRAEAHHDVVGRGPAPSSQRREARARDRAPAAPACRRSPDARTRPTTCCASVAYGPRPNASSRPPRRKRSDISRQATRQPRAPRARRTAADTCVAREEAARSTRRGKSSDGDRRDASASADPRQRIADQHVDDPRAAVARRRRAPCRAGSLAHLADDRRLLAAGRRAQRRQRARRRAPARRPRGTALRWRCAADRGPAARRRRAPSSRTGTALFAQHDARGRSRAPARSATVATPPRVGSRIQRSAGAGRVDQRLDQRAARSACRSGGRPRDRARRAPAGW